MPGMDGLEVCRRLKQIPKITQIAVIFLTALDEETPEELDLNLRAIDYISKPFSPAVRARVRNHLFLQRQRQQLEKLAHIDGFTSIPNRRHFDTKAATRMAKAVWAAAAPGPVTN